MTALCDGASNWWRIVDFFRGTLSVNEAILDWYHIAMKFQNTRFGDDEMNTQLSGAKWYLWHGLSDKAIERLQSIRESLMDDKKEKEKVQYY